MSDNFDYKKFLIENQLTTTSQGVAKRRGNNPPYLVAKFIFPNGNTSYNYTGNTIKTVDALKQYYVDNAKLNYRQGKTLSPIFQAIMDTEDHNQIQVKLVKTFDNEKEAKTLVDDLNAQDVKSVRKRAANVNTVAKKKVTGKKDTSSIKSSKPIGLGLGQKFDWKSVDPKTLSPHQAAMYWKKKEEEGW